MSYHQSSDEAPHARSLIRLWALALIFFVLTGAMCSSIGTLVLHSLPEPASNLSETQQPTPLPTTPPIYGLSGQATCQRITPPTKSPWLAVALADAKKYHLDVLAFAWQIWQESRFNPKAVSPAGAIGIAQFLPETAKRMGIDPRDPRQALDAAARLNSLHLKQYSSRARQLARHYGGSSAHYAYGLSLAAYNAGPGAVERVWARSFKSRDTSLWPSNAWDWLSHMPRETRQYVPIILGCL